MIDPVFLNSPQYACENLSRAALIEDSKDIGTCEGAGTIGLELAAFGPSLDGVLISLGAGAMATGVGHALKHRLPGIEVLTAQPEQAPR